MTTPDAIADLISRTALRDRAAFSALYDQTSSKLFGVCLRILRDRAEAEEALQDVYIKVWQRADRFDGGQARPMGWLVSIARNHSIDVIRARRTVNADIDEALQVRDPGPGPERETVLADDMSRVETCMQELEADRAAAVRDAYVEGYSYKELAERYGIPLNTMRTWLRRSLIKLRECLER